MTLSDLGWSAYWAAHLDALSLADARPARIVHQGRTRYVVQDGDGLRDAILPGRMRVDPEAGQPAVGDWVAVAGAEDVAVIQALLPRRTAFSRKVPGATTREQVVAANLDTVFVVMGLDGDFNPRRLERFVSQAWSSGATPVVLLNKADLCDDVEGRRIAAECAAPGAAVVVLAAQAGEGLELLRPWNSAGSTVALVGSSGVGKSTIVNRLLGHERMATGAVRADDSRGRHTTSHRELLPLPDGGLLLDTPGLREVQLWDSGEGVAQGFPEIEDLARACQFRDCAHGPEPGCAVRAAVESGALDARRYASYLKLRREVVFLEQRQSEAGQRRERQRGRERDRLIREVDRYHPKRRGGA